ncbi:translation initiation factor aIF-2 [Sulfodiicoccus acidiphilus]|uniref:Probable translation initiation factor IF-2 n=1 Tax=Sulfodiicoccus acidiphilus TaxID=1670455 RepID=A0A348B0D3_9CREN|nr:translation initiation factor aIF-2 [Sulfodiicoccus acidiphilus]GGT86953.1 translation initiation factor aIF-2 [Sulfodiicoccus acidiphilus]
MNRLSAVSSSDIKKLRQPIVTVLGHVDHGKTSLLDKIRGTAVVRKEAGEMTQEVGASVVPRSVIQKVAEPLKNIIPLKLEIPGLLFIDTPGHELFSNLRKRGGSVADISVVVVDVTEGFQKQTFESIQILRDRRVPFLMAANKIDRVPGWQPNPNQPFTVSISRQSKEVQSRLDTLIYKLVMDLAQLGFNAERFDRVRDFTRNVAIVPVSAKTGEGIPELLALLAGLSQRYMENRLKVVEGPAKGVVMEVKEEIGLGHTIDVIVYDGILKKNDILVLAGLNGPIVTRVRGILVPKPLQDIRIVKTDFVSLDEVVAAAGVKISAPGLEEAIAGSPLYVAEDESRIEQLKKVVEEEVSTIKIYNKDVSGVIIKSDSLGTLEAIVSAVSGEKIPIRLADVGPISKRDVLEAKLSEDEAYRVILAFRVRPLTGVDVSGVKLISNEIIYQLIDELERYIQEVRDRERRRTLESMSLPCKVKILPGFVFRRSDPIIVGVEVIGGVLKPGTTLIDKEGRQIGQVLQIQDKKKSLERATKGMEVAVSIKSNLMVGRHVNEGDFLYSDFTNDELGLLLKKFKDVVTNDMMEVIEETVKIKRKEDPLFALSVLN